MERIKTERVAVSKWEMTEILLAYDAVELAAVVAVVVVAVMDQR